VSGREVRVGAALAVALAIALLATSLASGQTAHPGTPQPTHAPTGADRLSGPAGPLAAVNYSWAEVNDSTDVPSMNPGYFATVDDIADGYVLLFGMSQWYDQIQTWIFSNGSWSELSPLDSPSGWLSDGLAYDPAAGEVIGTGVSIDGTVANQTWAFHAGNWQRIPTIGAPPALSGGQLAYDANNGSVVMFGGQSRSSVWSNETSIYRDGAWTEAPAGASPPPRSGFSLASDPSSGGVLLFGGIGTSASSDVLNDTWVFNAGAWTNVTSPEAAAPSARWGAAISTDPALTQDVLFGGAASDYDYTNGLSDTWTYANGTWQDVSPIFSPGGREQASLSYDPASGDLLLEGGCAGFCNYNEQGSADTWIFGAFAPPIRLTVSSTPAQPAPGTLVSMNSTVLGGVPPYSYNWSFDDGSSNSVDANTTHRFAATGDFYVRLTVTDSEYSIAGISQLIYVTNVTPMTGLLSIRPTLAYVEESVVASIAVGGGRLPFQISWNFGDGTPNDSYGGFEGGTPGISHDYAQPGSYVVDVSLADAIGDRVNESGNVTVRFPPAPFLVSIEANRTTGSAPLSVGFESIVPTGVIPTSYVWSFGDGSPDVATPWADHTFESAGWFVVQLTVANASGGSSTSSIIIEATSTPAPLAPLQVVLNAAPASSAAEGVATFVASVLGGSSPYAFNWSGLPAGCLSPDAPSIRCTLPDYAADVVVIVNVVDASGQRADATASVTVLPPASPSVGPNSTSIISQVLPPGFWWIMGAVAASSIACAAVVVTFLWRRPANGRRASVD
jgi:PKD repeat protein